MISSEFKRGTSKFSLSKFSLDPTGIVFVVSDTKDNNITILSATPHADKVYTDIDMTGPVAVIVGAEQYGLTDEWMKESSVNVKIPMLGKADSLNVATATTLLLYEAVRQRSK